MDYDLTSQALLPLQVSPMHMQHMILGQGFADRTMYHSWLYNKAKPSQAIQCKVTICQLAIWRCSPKSTALSVAKQQTSGPLRSLKLSESRKLNFTMLLRELRGYLGL